MSSFYTGLAGVASQLLKDKGQSLTLTRAVDSSYDPATGITTPGIATTYTGYGAAFNYMAGEIDGTLVQNGDIKLVLEATDTAPEKGDTVPIDSITYRAEDVNTISPAGTPVIYILQLRK